MLCRPPSHHSTVPPTHSPEKVTFPHELPPVEPPVVPPVLPLDEPPHVASPQMLCTSPTHCASHFVLQQYESLAQICFTHGSQVDVSFVPAVQMAWPQVPPVEPPEVDPPVLPPVEPPEVP